METRIVSGDAPTRQHAPLDHREINVARYQRGQLGKFVFAPNGCLIVSNRIPPRKWSILLDLLAVLRKWRHYQAPAHQRNSGNVTELHPRLFSKLLHKAKGENVAHLTPPSLLLAIFVPLPARERVRG
jgi:hypothetical protein